MPQLGQGGSGDGLAPHCPLCHSFGGGGHGGGCPNALRPPGSWQAWVPHGWQAAEPHQDCPCLIGNS